MKAPINVLGTPLMACSLEPKTGWYRDGCCNTDEDDVGSHTVCAQVTDEFLAFIQMQGNDLITPHLEFGFPGLKAGDQWCVCAASCRRCWFSTSQVSPFSLALQQCVCRVGVVHY